MIAARYMRAICAYFQPSAYMMSEAIFMPSNGILQYKLSDSGTNREGVGNERVLREINVDG